MLKSTEPKYSYGDILIKPSVSSDIKHRNSDCCPYTEEDNLPIFTAPMDTVVGKNSFKTWKDNRIIPIYPRTESFEDRVKFLRKGDWVSFGLVEFQEFLKKTDRSQGLQGKVLIEMANGHLNELYDTVFLAKRKFPDLIIMAGNIANPETYTLANDVDLDYIRCGIGGGSGCITTTQTGIHYPMASLISETAEIKRKTGGKTKIIADGGIRSYKDICVALALGADYVMIGGLLCGLIGSEAPEVTLQDGSLAKMFYGMASREGQIAMYGSKVKTVEGKSKLVPITGTIPGWVENTTDYIRSMMSYIGAKKLEDIYENAECIIGSQDTLNRINK